MSRISDTLGTVERNGDFEMCMLYPTALQVLGTIHPTFQYEINVFKSGSVMNLNNKSLVLITELFRRLEFLVDNDPNK